METKNWGISILGLLIICCTISSCVDSIAKAVAMSKRPLECGNNKVEEQD